MSIVLLFCSPRLYIAVDDPTCCAAVSLNGSMRLYVAYFGEKLWRIGTSLPALMYNAPSSASAAEDITALISWAMLRTAPLLCGFVSLDDMKKWHPAQLRAFGFLRYDALLWTKGNLYSRHLCDKLGNNVRRHDSKGSH
jgi:hypothetical protein